MAHRRVPGIFCVEGTWSSSLTDRASVREMLEILEDVDGIEYIHTRVSTVDGLMDALRKWRQKQYSRYSLGYFAFHGRPGRILIGRHPVRLKELGATLEDACAGKTLYFGSCSVLQVPERQIAQFRAQTKAECLVGFNRDIDWLASAALDLILLQAMALKRDPEDVERSLRHEYGDLADHLGLKMIYDAPPEAEAQPA